MSDVVTLDEGIVIVKNQISFSDVSVDQFCGKLSKGIQVYSLKHENPIPRRRNDEKTVCSHASH